MQAKVIMVASGKGGTGKSTVSVMLGAQLASLSKKVLLVELDSGLRSVDIISGVYGKTVYDIEDVLCGRCAGDKAVIESPIYAGLSVISAPYEGGEVRSEALQVLCDKMQPYFDFIILDTAAGMGAPFSAAATCASSAYLVLQADPVCLRDGRIVSDALFAKGVQDIRLVLNKVAQKTFQLGAVRDVDECIDTVCAQLIAIIPESVVLQKAAACGEALPQNCLVHTAFRRFARRVLGEKVGLAVG